MRGAVVGAVFAFGLTVLAGPVGESAGATGPSGKAVFGQLCQGCHTIGAGKSVGPDLQGLADRRDRSWVEKFILTPDVVIASGDPIAQQLVAEYKLSMPNLGVTAAQIGPLLAYLGYPNASPTPSPKPSPAPKPQAAGDAERGKQLFTGHDRFDNGGPPCLSCHSIAGAGSLGGGTLGPDLTGAFAKYGGAKGLGTVLETLPFPTMAPIFSGSPLTASERGDLVAFFQDAPNAERSARAIGKLVGLSAIVVALLAALAFAIWRRRLTGVRIPLVNRPRGK